MYSNRHIAPEDCIMKKLRAITLFSIVAVLLLASCSTKPWTSFLPELEGEYQIIGTTKIVLDDPRQLLIQVWYPAENKGDGVIDPMITKEQADVFVNMTLPIGKQQMESRLPSSSWVDAPILPSSEPYPIIIFDHGFEGYEKQNMTQMEELASHGYVVFGVNHPYESFVTQYPNGDVVIIDHEKYPSLTASTNKQRITNAENTSEFLEMIRDAKTDEDKIEAMRVFSSIPRISNLNLAIKERTRDIVNFMDALVKMSEEGFFAGLIDIDKVGMYGHSMGGNVTNSIASMDKLPVNLKVAANLDGPQLIFPGDSLEFPKVPFMICYSTNQGYGDIIIDMHGVSDWILTGSELETWRAVFNGNTHLNFTDLTYISQLEGKTTGKIDGTASGLAQERLLVAWFNRHLKGIDTDMGQLDMSYDLWELGYEFLD